MAKLMTNTSGTTVQVAHNSIPYHDWLMGDSRTCSCCGREIRFYVAINQKYYATDCAAWVLGIGDAPHPRHTAADSKAFNEMLRNLPVA